MTREEAITILKQTDRIGCNLIKANDEESTKYNQESIEALGMAINALEIVEEFEKAQIISSGRLNGRTYAYKCGLDDGKRKALEQEGYYKDLAQSYEKTIVKLNEAIAERLSGDCVSRKDVIESLNNHWLSGGCAKRIIDEQIDEVKKLPSVTSMPLPSEDCVSRQAVLAGINDWWGITMTAGEPTICDYIRELPPATPAHKVGKWTKISNTVPCMNCPICGSTFTLILGGDKMHFCPNCGAEMESEE